LSGYWQPCTRERVLHPSPKCRARGACNTH